MNSNNVYRNIFPIWLGIISGVIFPVFGQGTHAHGSVLYEQYDSLGMNIAVYGYESDLATIGFDNRAHSTCVFGFWLFYDKSDYGWGGMHYAYSGNLVTPYCFNFEEDSTAGLVSSVRYSGSPNDISADTFNLYEYYWFMGKEEYILIDRPNLSLAGAHASIIITGYSNWTVFEENNYSGPRICLVPTGSRAIIVDMIDIGIQHGVLRSVRKGCDSDPSVIVTLQSPPMSGSNYAVRSNQNV